MFKVCHLKLNDKGIFYILLEDDHFLIVDEALDSLSRPDDKFFVVGLKELRLKRGHSSSIG